MIITLQELLGVLRTAQLDDQGVPPEESLSVLFAPLAPGAAIRTDHLTRADGGHLLVDYNTRGEVIGIEL